jgi:beta-mannosidase
MKTEIPLSTGWRLRFCDWREGRRAGFATADPGDRWMDAVVPGDVHLDCLREGSIPDPFFGTNMDRCIWMEDKDWWYRLDFAAPPRQADQRIFLSFEGLDTFATVFLNGKEVGQHQNMFTPLRIDVTDALARQTNRLAVCLASSRFSARRDGPASVSGAPPRDRLFTRKAQACYGWDIAPRLVTCGIWRPVSLLVVDALEIRRVGVRTITAAETSAEVEVSIDVLRHAAPPAQPVLEVTIDGRTVAIPFDCDSAYTTVVKTLALDSPRLWWPHDRGTPHLYDYEVTLACGGERFDSTRGRCGIRTAQLVQEPTADGGTSFRFAVNGTPVFLKGMNWTPADALYARVDNRRYGELLDAAADAHINALRVWGGGVYEEDAFYERCDELGILVWQDFMFACGCYPQDEEFLRDVETEADEVVGRLRSHPCLLTWCGDNENDMLAGRYGVPDYRFNRLSKEVLPAVVRRLSPHIPYVPSSPFSSRVPDQNSDLEGDVHLWAHGRSYASDFYLARRPKMVTEMGHLALPDMATIRTFIPEADRWPIWNDAWRLHSADPLRVAWNQRLKTLFESIRARGWEEPATLEDLIEKSQRLQAEATAIWIRHFSGLPDCWGLFLWNLADCWPQVSDAYIAYPFQPKPAWWTVKEEYGKIVR